MTYKKADSLLQGRCKKSRKLTNNTYLERDGKDICVRLHRTNILRFKPDGRIIVVTGGWETVTTKDRINRYLPGNYRISQHSHVWYWHEGWKRGFPFKDGDEIAANGELKAQARV